MDRATATDWASRIRGTELTKENITVVWKTIEDRVKQFGSRFSPVRMSGLWPFTRRLTFHPGYLGMDPEKIPRVHEVEKERRARELLKDEGELWSRFSVDSVPGLGELVFPTRLD